MQVFHRGATMYVYIGYLPIYYIILWEDYLHTYTHIVYVNLLYFVDQQATLSSKDKQTNAYYYTGVPHTENTRCSCRAVKYFQS